MIDDDEMVRILFRDTFWIYGDKKITIDVVTVHTIAQAQRYLAEQGSPDVVFIGLFLLKEGSAVARDPQPSLEFIKYLRTQEKYAHLLIVVYSRYDESEFKESAEAAGADKYLVKGTLTPQEIVTFVETL